MTGPQFVILGPAAQMREMAGQKDRFEAFMAERFPGYRFEMGQELPGDDSDVVEDLMVLPIKGAIGDHGDFKQFGQVGPEEMRLICEAVEAFSTGAVAKLN